MITEQYSMDNLAQLVSVSLALLFVIFFFIEKKLDQAQRILDELNLKCIENKLNDYNSKLYLHFYINKFHESKLNSYISYFFLCILELLFTTFAYNLLNFYSEEEKFFIQGIVLFLFFLSLIIFYEILQAPYSYFFREWDPILLLRSECYKVLYDTIGSYEMDDAFRYYYQLKKEYENEKGLKKAIGFLILITIIGLTQLPSL